MIFVCHIYIYATIRFELENIIFVSDLVAWWPKMAFTKFQFVCFTDPTIMFPVTFVGHNFDIVPCLN